jgi:hypothetical protein
LGEPVRERGVWPLRPLILRSCVCRGLQPGGGQLLDQRILRESRGQVPPCLPPHSFPCSQTSLLMAFEKAWHLKSRTGFYPHLTGICDVIGVCDGGWLCEGVGVCGMVCAIQYVGIVKGLGHRTEGESLPGE